MRHYYKTIDGKGFLNLKTPLADATGYVEITEEEFNVSTEVPAPTAEQLAKRNAAKELARCKARLRNLDYIGIKIATGRATVEEYAEQIAEMNRLADRINELESENG